MKSIHNDHQKSIQKFLSRNPKPVHSILELFPSLHNIIRTENRLNGDNRKENKNLKKNCEAGKRRRTSLADGSGNTTSNKLRRATYLPLPPGLDHNGLRRIEPPSFHHYPDSRFCLHFNNCHLYVRLNLYKLPKSTNNRLKLGENPTEKAICDCCL